MSAPDLQFGLRSEVLEKLLSVFHKHPNVERVTIYGSRSIGNYRNGSDIDLTMIGDKLQWSDLQVIEQEIDELLLPYKVDLSIFNQIDNPDLLNHIEQWGKELALVGNAP